VKLTTEGVGFTDIVIEPDVAVGVVIQELLMSEQVMTLPLASEVDA
jgi:hypothetical protein